MANIPVALVGQALSVTNRFIHGHFMVVQILFQPGALYRLTGIPSCELNDAYLEADSVLTKEVHLVNEALFHAANYREIVQIANGFIARLVRKTATDSHPIDRVCQWMLVNPAVSLDNLA